MSSGRAHFSAQKIAVKKSSNFHFFLPGKKRVFNLKLNFILIIIFYQYNNGLPSVISLFYPFGNFRISKENLGKKTLHWSLSQHFEKMAR